jgi:hypothetical protein
MSKGERLPKKEQRACGLTPLTATKWCNPLNEKTLKKVLKNP